MLAIAPSVPHRLADTQLAYRTIAEHRVGYGRVVWLALSPTHEALSAPPEPAALRIKETGNVPLLRVENHGRSTVVVIAHTVLSGGLQTRVVERSAVILAGSEVSLPVRCVEHGRWSPKHGQNAGSFRAVDRMGVGMRQTLEQTKSESMRVSGTYTLSQERVWREVDEELTRTSIHSRTSSYEAVVTNVRSRTVGLARETGITPPPDANAVLLAPERAGIWLEGFASPSSLAAHAEGLLADLFEPPQRRAAEGHASVDTMLAWLWRRQIAQVSTVEGTPGVAMALSSSRASGEVLWLDDKLAHIMIGSSVALA